MPSLATYFHTLRYLKAEQLLGQAARRVTRQRFCPVGPLPLRPTSGHWVAGPEQPSTMLAADRFMFIGSPGGLEGGWNDAAQSALWTYNLHYFDDLRRAGWRQRADWHVELIARWMAENPPPKGVAWQPYPTSLRIVNWIAWGLARGSLPAAAAAHLADQAAWLSCNLETHLLGNHLFANLKALVFAGCFFEGALAKGWLSIGLGRLETELDEQVLADGGNFELSPMYHGIFLTDVLDLVNLAQVFPGCLPDRLEEKLRETAGRMLGWLAVMTHPDGEIAQFNDAAIGMAPNLSQLGSYASALRIAPRDVGRTLENAGVTARQLPESGYVRMECPRAVVICDVARVGPDYLPGHAHADTLSYELSVAGRRIVVNGGTSRYGNDAPRVRERSTASHSTVEIDGRSSSQVWSGFRVARRARPFDVSLDKAEAALRLSAAHDGYVRLPGAPIHRRTWTMGRHNLQICDNIGANLNACARHVLHPDAVEDLPEGLSYAVREPAELRPARHAPYFGVSLETRAIVVPLVNGHAEICWCWG